VAETKGNISTMELREVESAKISCARKHFQAISSDKVKFDVVENYKQLMGLVK
jgi:type III restriction enzyme